MTGSSRRHHTPGTSLLTIARWVFDAPVVDAVVEPTIADFQQELIAAGTDRAARIRARWRGYRAFWTLVLLAPFTAMDVPCEDTGIPTLRPSLTRMTVTAVILTILVAIGPELLIAVGIVGMVGGAVAMAMHRWNTDHPSELPTPPERRTGTPQINFSSTEVAGNVGGLIFVVGTVFIAAMGFPGVMGFLVAALVSGAFLARWLVAWHASHPKSGLPEGRIAKVLRS